MTVAESSGNIEAIVKVLNGRISSPVVVEFSTLSRTAIGQSSLNLSVHKCIIIRMYIRYGQGLDNY